MGTVVLVAGVVFWADSILLLRGERSRNHFPGFWELPGGKVEFGEHPSDAVQREVYEETQIHGKVTGLPFHVFSSILGEQHCIQLNYLIANIGEFHQDAVKLGKEHTEYTWIGEDQDLPVPISPEIKETIETAFRIYKQTSIQT